MLTSPVEMFCLSFFCCLGFFKKLIWVDYDKDRSVSFRISLNQVHLNIQDFVGKALHKGEN